MFVLDDTRSFATYRCCCVIFAICSFLVDYADTNKDAYRDDKRDLARAGNHTVVCIGDL